MTKFTVTIKTGAQPSDAWVIFRSDSQDEYLKMLCSDVLRLSTVQTLHDAA